MEPIFLTIGEVLEIYLNQIETYGGEVGVRDFNLLQSALAQPEATFSGQYLHRDLFEMAAAYVFHIVRNHPFVDGNKRTGAVAAIVFLYMNGVEIIVDEDTLADAILAVAEGKWDKSQIAYLLKTAASSPT